MFRKLRVERDGCVCSRRRARLGRTLAASGKMSFVSLAWLTKAVAAKPRSRRTARRRGVARV